MRGTCAAGSSATARGSIALSVRPYGGKKHQPQDSYSYVRRSAWRGATRSAQAARVLEIELNAVTDNPLVFPEAAAPLDRQVISGWPFHGMPLALAMSYVKAAIPVLASISERRLNKLVDLATSDGLPASWSATRTAPNRVS